MLDGIMRGRIEDWMWVKIIEKMYEERDADILHEKIRSVIATRRAIEQDDPSHSQRKLTREELNN